MTDRRNIYPRSGPIRGLLTRVKSGVDITPPDSGGRMLVRKVHTRGRPMRRCVWCGQPVRRGRWHTNCVPAYMASRGSVRFVGTTKRLIAGHVCEACGTDMSKNTRDIPNRRYAKRMLHGEVDHRYPIWRARLDQAAGRRGWWKAWTVANLQILCRDCHLRKCADEAAERAKLKKSCDFL